MAFYLLNIKLKEKTNESNENDIHIIIKYLELITDNPIKYLKKITKKYNNHDIKIDTNKYSQNVTIQFSYYKVYIDNILTFYII